ncbi:MAG: hypothetical protein ACRDIE_18480, partial [Chloroflexota bacterium]
MPSLASRYADLLSSRPDPTLQQVVSELDRAYGAENPKVGPPPEWRAQLATTLAHHAAETRPRRARFGRLPIYSWRQACLAVVLSVVALSVSILGLAVTDNPRYETPNLPPPSYMIRALGLYGHAANQSWQYCGYTVSVVRTYGDANRTFAGLEGTSELTATGILPGTNRRTRLQPMDRWLGGMKGNTAAMYSTFDTHQIAHG